MAPALPKLFLVHFAQTSFVAETEGRVVGFVVGFVSQTLSDEAYIHFLGVHPDFRKHGLARALYNRFFQQAAALGRSVVRCVTSTLNQDSIAFHLAMGFSIEPGKSTRDGVAWTKDYDGPGEDRVLFVKRIGTAIGS